MPVVDIDVHPGSGTFDATLKDPQGAPGGPVNVIQVGDGWTVDCTWSITGLISYIPGEWRIQVLLEGMGAAAEFQETRTEPMVPLQTTPYHKPVEFPPNYFQQYLGAEDSVSFHVTAVLTARAMPVNAPLPVAAMVDLGVVQIYRFP